MAEAEQACSARLESAVALREVEGCALMESLCVKWSARRTLRPGHSEVTHSLMQLDCQAGR